MNAEQQMSAYEAAYWKQGTGRVTKLVVFELALMGLIKKEKDGSHDKIVAIPTDHTLNKFQQQVHIFLSNPCLTGALLEDWRQRILADMCTSYQVYYDLAKELYREQHQQASPASNKAKELATNSAFITLLACIILCIIYIKSDFIGQLAFSAVWISMAVFLVVYGISAIVFGLKDKTPKPEEVRKPLPLKYQLPDKKIYTVENTRKEIANFLQGKPYSHDSILQGIALHGIHEIEATGNELLDFLISDDWKIPYGYRKSTDDGGTGFGCAGSPGCGSGCGGSGCGGSGCGGGGCGGGG